MDRVFVIFADNGEDYEQNMQWVAGIFTSREEAQSALDEALSAARAQNEIVANWLREYARTQPPPPDWVKDFKGRCAWNAREAEARSAAGIEYADMSTSATYQIQEIPTNTLGCFGFES